MPDVTPATPDPSAPLAPVLPLVAQLIPGNQTSEYKLARLTSYFAMAAAACGLVMEALAQAQVFFPNAKGIGAALAIAGMIAKAVASFGYSQSRATVKAAALSQPRGCARLRLTLALALLCALFVAGAARAQSTDPSSATSTVTSSTSAASLLAALDSGVTIQVNDDLAFHPGVSVGSVGWDFSAKKAVVGLSFTGLYILTSKRFDDAGFGLGGSYTPAGTTPPWYSITEAFVTPGVDPLTGKFRAGSGTFHLAIAAQEKLGSQHGVSVTVQPGFNF